MKKFVSFLFSMFFTGILFVVFAISIGYATFIENDYGTTTAKILIYNARWFEILLLVISVNLIGSIIINGLVSKKKWTNFLFHFAFLFIILGAAFTRYIGYEGTMHIREGDSSNTIVSTESFINVSASDENQTVSDETEVLFSPYASNRFSETLHLDNQEIHFENLQYVPSAVESVVPNPSGEPIVSVLTVNPGMQRNDFNLKQGNSKQVDGYSLGFESAENNDVSLFINDGTLFISANDSLRVTGMQGTEPIVIPPGESAQIETQKVYSMGELNFAVKQFFMKAVTQLEYDPSQRGGAANDALRMLVTVGDQSKELIVFGQKGVVSNPVNARINGVTVSASYGSKNIELPFSLYLEDFQLERYPGSNSPSSYASEVVLRDGEVEMPYRIFMNNILKYEGYRFFQSSYDQDERGTILSVNYDVLGTSVTYFGYLIMTIGMILTLFNRSSRFRSLVKGSGKMREKRRKLFAVLIFAFSFSAVSAQTPNLQPPDKQHVKEFEELLLQSRKGRVEPAATLASEIMRKVAKKQKWEGMSASAVFLDMQASPEKWRNVRFIKVANPELRNFLGINGKYAAFNDIVTSRERGGYKLSSLVNAAYEKSSAKRNKLEKEVINVDERVNILNSVFTGHFFTVFPVPGDENKKWVSVNEAETLGGEHQVFAEQIVSNYFSAVGNRNWPAANQLLAQLKSYQQQQGAEIIPSKTKIKLEVLYHKLDVFGKLSKIFMTLGLVLLFIQLITIFNPKVKLNKLRRGGFLLIVLLFLVHTAGLAVRWYISGHAPWSNGYESMVFVSWATLLAGLIFVRRSEITLSLTTLLAGLTLLVASFSWMSPEITNLVPVLKSYWLIVHVAVIMASYGFLGIAALLGLLNLILMVFRTPGNLTRISFTIKELVYIINISLILGLFTLTIGSFLGGVWANESWGRYWGWDPKETWAMVTILVYAFIVHMYKIPGLKGNYAISAASLLGFGSVLMTYFGVNYYLSGLHSYAQGEPAPIPNGVYIAVFLVLVLVTAAYFSETKRKQQKLK
ncbi:cytochrome c-type biogenesis protein CcsB [Tangfeifania diversioriginum]|uniref:Cytochrome c-type biogenesis protein CcsB n=1 Tax=Tangfeifania diversioriginum TaxID=1168035 RepID=A0A1M6JLD7_9BACT|nr:cytochrome c biogenesis protein CcsA [Tangfeifania diversioriginum]SHJ47503.1 cytochrome c-type biogenesis protein CcsB [Tangfeifania diversioriginum]